MTPRRLPALAGLLIASLVASPAASPAAAQAMAQSLAPATREPGAAATCAPARTALVLSGGGTKGFTHLGVLQVLDSLGIVPDLIVGTSMGSIIGALYASGASPAEVRERLAEVPLEALIRSYEPTISASLGGLKPILVWQREPEHWVLQPGAVREAELNAALSKLALRANLIARGDFDSLPIPFRAVATDLDTREVVSLARGDLALALRASMSIPLILRPVAIDGRTLVDGGLSSNVPVGLARTMGAERVIVSRVTSARADPSAFDDPLRVTGQLLEFLFVQDPVLAREHDVDIVQPTEAFANLDVRPVMLDSLTRVGRRMAEAAFAAAGCVRPLATERRRPQVPATIGSVRITPERISARDAVLRELNVIARGPLVVDAIAAGLTSFAADERYRGAWLNPGGDSTRVDLAVRLEEAPQRSLGIGVAFDHTMSGRIWLAAVDHSILGRDLEGSALVAAGIWRSDLTLSARRQARVGARYVPVGGSLHLLSEDVRLWDDAVELPSVGAQELAVVLGVRPLYEPGWSWEFGADYRLWRTRGSPARGTAGARFAVRHLAAGTAIPDVQVEAVGLDAWQRVSLDVARTRRFGTLEVRPRVRAGWGRKLPVHQTFTLGGFDGFAGLRILEQRGDHELFGSLLFRWPLVDRLSARIEPMVGATGLNRLLAGPGAFDEVILVGARAGVELSTPFGPIRVEEGFNNQGRRQTLIRVGLWF